MVVGLEFVYKGRLANGGLHCCARTQLFHLGTVSNYYLYVFCLKVIGFSNTEGYGPILGILIRKKVMERRKEYDRMKLENEQKKDRAGSCARRLWRCRSVQHMIRKVII